MRLSASCLVILHMYPISHEYQSTARANAWCCISTARQCLVLYWHGAPMLGMFVSYWPCAAHLKMRLWRRAVRISSTSAKRHLSIAEWSGWSTTLLPDTDYGAVS